MERSRRRARLQRCRFCWDPIAGASGDIILLAAGAPVVDPATGQGTLTLTTNNPNVGEGGYETLAVQFVNLNHALIVQFDGSQRPAEAWICKRCRARSTTGTMPSPSPEKTPVTRRLSRSVFSISSGGTPCRALSTWTISEPRLDSYAGNAFHRHDHWARCIRPGNHHQRRSAANALNYYVVGPEAIRIIDVDPSIRASAQPSARARVLQQCIAGKLHIRCREQRGGWKSLCRGGHVCHGFHGRHVHWLRGRQ